MGYEVGRMGIMVYVGIVFKNSAGSRSINSLDRSKIECQYRGNTSPSYGQVLPAHRLRQIGSIGSFRLPATFSETGLEIESTVSNI